MPPTGQLIAARKQRGGCDIKRANGRWMFVGPFVAR